MQKLRKNLIIFMFLLSCNGYASESDSTGTDRKYLDLGFGLMHLTVKDQINTCLPYHGLNFGIKLGYSTQKSNRYFGVNNTFSTGNIYPYRIPNYENPVKSYFDKLNIQLLWSVYSIPKHSLKVYLGPEIKSQLSLRIMSAKVGNSSLAYEGTLAGQVVGRIEKRFSLFPFLKKANQDRNFCFVYSLSCPFYAKVFTPSYIGLPENILQEESGIIDWNSNYDSFLTKFVNIEMDLSLRYTLKNNNAIAFNYMQNYIATYPKFNHSKSLNRFFGISLLYNLK